MGSEGRGTLRDICWLMGPRGIQKGQGGYQVPAEDGGSECQCRKHRGQRWVSKGYIQEAISSAGEMSYGDDQGIMQSGLWGQGNWPATWPLGMGNTMRRGSLGGQDGRAGHKVHSFTYN